MVSFIKKIKISFFEYVFVVSGIVVGSIGENPKLIKLEKKLK